MIGEVEARLEALLLVASPSGRGRPRPARRAGSSGPAAGRRWPGAPARAGRQRQAAAVALVGDRRVGIPGADHERASGQGRPDHVVDVLRPGGVEQEGVGPRARAATESWPASIRMSRISSPTGVPPGSRVRTTGRPAASASVADPAPAWIVLPEPSGPSNVTNQPRRWPAHDRRTPAARPGSRGGV